MSHTFRILQPHGFVQGRRMSHFPCCGNNSVHGKRVRSAWKPLSPLPSPSLVGRQSCPILGKKGDSYTYFFSMQGERRMGKKMEESEIERDGVRNHIKRGNRGQQKEKEP